MAFHHGMPRTARYRIRLCRCASVGSHTSSSHEVVRCRPKQIRHLVRVGTLADRPDGFEYHKEIGYRRAADGSGVGAKVVTRSPRLYASMAFGEAAHLSLQGPTENHGGGWPPDFHVGYQVHRCLKISGKGWSPLSDDRRRGPYISIQDDETIHAVSAGEPDRYGAAAVKKVALSIMTKAPT